VKTHKQVWEETIERYIRRELGEEERRNFEEHLLDCTECFEEVQVQERFAAGVRHSGQIGLLTGAAPGRGYRWLAPAFAAALAASVIVGAVWIWTLQRSLNESMHARDVLARQIAEARPSPEPAPPPVFSGPLIASNLPIAVLNANRAAGGETVLAVPAASQEIALWMDVEPNGRYRTLAVAVDSGETGQAVATIAGLTRNSEGAVAVVLPAAKLPAGRYTIRLSSEAPPRLLAQYNLRIAIQ
jgi:hypothetical protein